MWQKIRFVIRESEWKALVKLAEDEYRYPHDQAALIIHNELERRGLLPAPTETEPAQPTNPT